MPHDFCFVFLIFTTKMYEKTKKSHSNFKKQHKKIFRKSKKKDLNKFFSPQ